MVLNFQRHIISHFQMFFSEILSEPQKSVHSPRLSLDGKSLFWLQRAVGGAHGGCHQLIKMNLVTKEVSF